jgi:hypothetical protein
MDGIAVLDPKLRGRGLKRFISNTFSLTIKEINSFADSKSENLVSILSNFKSTNEEKLFVSNFQSRTNLNYLIKKQELEEKPVSVILYKGSEREEIINYIELILNNFIKKYLKINNRKKSSSLEEYSKNLLYNAKKIAKKFQIFSGFHNVNISTIKYEKNFKLALGRYKYLKLGLINKDELKYNSIIKNKFFLDLLEKKGSFFDLNLFRIEDIIEVFDSISSDKKITQVREITNKLNKNKKYWNKIRQYTKFKNPYIERIKISEEDYVNPLNEIDMNFRSISQELRGFEGVEFFQKNLEILRILIMKVIKAKSENLHLIENIIYDFDEKFNREYEEKFNKKQTEIKKRDNSMLMNSKMVDINKKMRNLEGSLGL